MEKATFAAGCFWGVEAAFRRLPGVSATAVGYEGGTLDNPSYERVCNGDTGHAEAVQVEFDPVQVSYKELVRLFFSIHDPTTMNRQGPDFGSQYRSAIFVHSPAQRQLAEQVIADIAPKLERPIVTQVTPATTFWMGEEYHQRYFEKQGVEPTCAIPTKP